MNSNTKRLVRRAADSIVNAAKMPTQNQPTLTVVWATVVSIQTSPHNSLTVFMLGSTASIGGIRYDSSYSPTVNDTVWGLKNGTDYFVVGKMA